MTNFRNVLNFKFAVSFAIRIALQYILVLTFTVLSSTSWAQPVFERCPSAPVATTIAIGSSQGRLYLSNTGTGGATSLTISPFTNRAINAMAANSDTQIIYYGTNETNIYYWEPSAGTGAAAHQFIADLSTFPNFSGAKLQSGGGAYLNGIYYVGSETTPGPQGDIEDIFAVQMSADGKERCICNASKCSSSSIGCWL